SLAAMNAPDEVVMSGPHAALNTVLSRFGARATKLRVQGPWHSEAMRSAVGDFRAEIERRLGGRGATTPLVAAREELGLVDTLAEGLVQPVRFTDVLARLEDEGVTRMVVAAPSRLVRSLIRRTLRARVEVLGADTPARLTR